MLPPALHGRRRIKHPARGYERRVLQRGVSHRLLEGVDLSCELALLRDRVGRTGIAGHRQLLDSLPKFADLFLQILNALLHTIQDDPGLPRELGGAESEIGLCEGVKTTNSLGVSGRS